MLVVLCIVCIETISLFSIYRSLATLENPCLVRLSIIFYTLSFAVARSLHNIAPSIIIERGIALL
jgi:hypothetical protein